MIVSAWLWQRYSKNKLKAIHNGTDKREMFTIAVAKVFKEQIESNSQLDDFAHEGLIRCGKGIQRTN